MALTHPTVAAFEGFMSAIGRWTVRYDKTTDTLFVTDGKPRPAVSFDLDGIISLRYMPANGEVVGVEIDGWERRFLPKHPELLRKWQRAQGLRFIGLRVLPKSRGYVPQSSPQLAPHLASAFKQMLAGDSMKMLHSA